METEHVIEVENLVQRQPALLPCRHHGGSERPVVVQALGFPDLVFVEEIEFTDMDAIVDAVIVVF